MRILVRSALALAALALIVPAGVVTFIMWPYFTYDETVVELQRRDPLPIGTEDRLVAGVAIRDITPPIGMPKFGYSSIGRDGDGFRNRLRARVFYLRSPGDRPVVIIQTDLGAGSLILHHRVAELIAGKTDVGIGNFSITSTHTHSGPGLYLESNFYNAHGSRHGGFDPKLMEFFAERLSDAVIAAYEARRPALVATGQRRVWGATRNRSLAAWLRNPVAAGKEHTHQQEFAAVNPAMTMVRIDLQSDDGSFQPAGALTLYSIHGTGIPAQSNPYHADVWAYFARDVEWAIRDHYDPPWEPAHGTFQATHGDTTPAWRFGLRGESESHRLGSHLAGHAWELFRELEDELRSDLVVRSAMRELDLLTLPDEQRHGLCDRAILGAATVGAALGDENPASYLWPFAKGWPRRFFTDNCHRQKHWLGSLFQLLVPADIFPHLALLHAVQIGDFLIFAAPWEITMESGNRMKQAIADAIPDADGMIIEVSSLANGFMAYSTTPEEYSLQFYEGGHTIWGPGTTSFLANHAASLFGDLFARGGFAELPDSWRFELSSTPIMPEAQQPIRNRGLVRAPQLERGEHTAGPYWSFRYRDVGRGALELDRPLMRIEAKNEAGAWGTLLKDGRPVTDQEYDMQIVHLVDLGGGMAEYELRWFRPDFDADREHRFYVEPRAGLGEFVSPVF